MHSIHSALYYAYKGTESEGKVFMLREDYDPTMDTEIDEWDGSDAPYQSIKGVFQDLQDGIELWIAIGSFTQSWFGSYYARRQILVEEPIDNHHVTSIDMWRMACFCAASVLDLARNAGMDASEWAQDKKYLLEEPFYMFETHYNPSYRAQLRTD